jgi:hypothetical protein
VHWHSEKKETDPHPGQLPKVLDKKAPTVRTHGGTKLLARKMTGALAYELYAAPRSS